MYFFKIHRAQFPKTVYSICEISNLMILTDITTTGEKCFLWRKVGHLNRENIHLHKLQSSLRAASNQLRSVRLKPRLHTNSRTRSMTVSYTLGVCISLLGSLNTMASWSSVHVWNVLLFYEPIVVILFG